MSSTVKITDLHSHILPCADHGSDSIETTKKQLMLMSDAGVDTVVATPHFYPHRHTVEQFLARRDKAVNDLLSIHVTRPKICLGAEVLYCDGLDRMEGLSSLCIEGTNVLLLELPMDGIEQSLIETVRRLLKEYTVVLVHIDRYIERMSNEIDTMLEMGALAQINTACLFSFSVKRKIMPYVRGGLIEALGSDLHGADKRTYKQFSDAEKKLGGEYTAIMERSANLIKNSKFI